MARTKSSNKKLRNADKAKKDEFYTQLNNIENEMQYYQEYFQDKIIFCNCDDPYESNFFKYFAANFKSLKLKKLIATSYVDSLVQGQQISFLDMKELTNQTDNKRPYKVEITQVPAKDTDGTIDLSDVEYLLKNKQNVLTPLSDDGDFRSKECIELLKEADIVVTNPPFSLFREYVNQLMTYDKKFIIIGNHNAITYKEIFKLIKGNKIWLGRNTHGTNMEFQVPEEYPLNSALGRIDENGNKFLTVSGVIWYTNLDIKKHHEDLDLGKKYYGNESEYPKYDNYNAINTDKTKDIPKDYEGVMGVPITFMNKYNPDQFELLGIMNTGEQNKGIRYEGTPHGRPLVNGVEKYLRILIKNKRVE
jgi:hypothetical protein